MKYSVLAVAALSLAGCETTQQIDYDYVQFKGDSSPKLTSSQIRSGSLDNLTEGEAVMIAKATDGSGAVSQPNFVGAQIVETLLANRNDRDNLEALRKRCDPDNDGIWDIFCPELSKVRGRLSSGRYVNFQSYYSIAHKETLNGQWTSSVKIDRAKPSAGTMPINLRLFSINRGNKSFEGDVEFIIDLPPQVEFQGVDLVQNIRDQRGTKQVLSMLPIIQYVTLAMSDYPTSQLTEQVETQMSDDGLLRIVVKNKTLDENEGVSIDYSVKYLAEDG